MRPLAIPEMYRSLHGYLVQRIPDDCDSRLTNLIYLMMGMFQARSVQLDLIARKTPIRAKKLSLVKRLGRFLNNAAVRVRDWYRPFAEGGVAAARGMGQIHLILDTTKVAFGFRLVMVGVAYRGRSVPLAWAWAVGSRGHTTTLPSRTTPQANQPAIRKSGHDMPAAKRWWNSPPLLASPSSGCRRFCVVGGSEGETAMIEHLRPLTQDQRQTAYQIAREAVLQAIGPKPGREHFAGETISRYPVSVTRLITFLCLILLLAAFTPSTIRLYVIGSQTFGQAVPNQTAKQLVGLATVLSAEVGQVVFSLALATLGTSSSATLARWLRESKAAQTIRCTGPLVVMTSDVVTEQE